MPMNGSDLGAALARAAASVSPQTYTAPDGTIDGETYRKAVWDAIGWAIVFHIQTKAQVTIPPAVIVTNGGPSTQTGPPASVTLPPTIR